MSEQNFANHRKFVPGYHYVIFGILTVNLVWSLFRLVQGLPGVPVFDRFLAVAMAVAFLLIALYARTFPLRVQDRVIRLEETERMERLLPPDLRSRAGELRPGQLVALRFASDEELPELTRAVLDEKIVKQDDIKKRIRSWRADHLRM
jgi:type VI protein secretion system component VasK